MFTIKQNIVVILVSIVLLAIGVAVIQYMGTVPMYTNMTESFALRQEEQMVMNQVHACQDAGGQWYAGFSSAGCTAEFVQPKPSRHYIVPVLNNWHQMCYDLIFPVTVIIIAMSLITGIASIVDLLRSIIE